MTEMLQLGDTFVDALKFKELCFRYHVRELSLFGSAARGEMHRDSDLDLMVEFQPGVRVGIVRFETFADELQSLAGCRIDLVARRGLKPWVKPAVLKGARLLYVASVVVSEGHPLGLQKK